jgi:hypothetical protein
MVNAPVVTIESGNSFGAPNSCLRSKKEKAKNLSDTRRESPARIRTIDVIVNAALSQFKRRHRAQFVE